MPPTPDKSYRIAACTNENFWDQAPKHWLSIILVEVQLDQDCKSCFHFTHTTTRWDVRICNNDATKATQRVFMDIMFEHGISKFKPNSLATAATLYGSHEVKAQRKIGHFSWPNLYLNENHSQNLRVCLQLSVKKVTI